MKQYLRGVSRGTTESDFHKQYYRFKVFNYIYIYIS